MDTFNPEALPISFYLALIKSGFFFLRVFNNPLMIKENRLFGHGQSL
ncbi:hypothetical protein WCT82_03520 [Pectobacterium carotovorum]|nr:hypothetical protein [Pectobacterium carotovorum]